MGTSAPPPGVGAHIDAAKEAQRVLKVRLRDREFRIAANNIPMRVKAQFMQETGQSVEWYLNPSRFGDVALCGLWFLSRLIDGETVTWGEVLDEWEAAQFTQDDIEAIEDDGEANDPEV